MRIDSLITSLDVSQDVAVAREGEIDVQFVVVVRGELVVSSQTREVARLGVGECVGGRMLARLPRTTTVVATPTSEVITCSRREFASILQVAPEVARFLLFTADELLQREVMLERAREGGTARALLALANS